MATDDPGEPDETKSMAEDITPGNIYVIQEHDSKKLHSVCYLKKC
jgi:hypothetical protein